MVTAPVEIGDTSVGKYRVERVLGAGGMGVVVQALHEGLGQRVALKFLLPEALLSAKALARFDREARAVAKLRGEHVARVLDVGRLENGAPYIVMEFLEGQDLSELLRQHGPLPVGVAVEYVLQAGEAIAEAHRAGIVHRDLKPANLFRTTRPDGTAQIKVLDFGISKWTDNGLLEADSDLTQTSGLMGSPLYMSPEQLESAKNVGRESDVWSLGVVLHELVTGRPPFAAESLAKLCIAILEQSPEPPSQAKPGLPTELDTVVLRCLQKDRAERYGSIAELAIALGPLAPERARVSVERIVKLLDPAGMPEAVAAALAPTQYATRELATGTESGAAGATHQSWFRTANGGPLKSTARTWLVVALLSLLAGAALYLAQGGDRAGASTKPGTSASASSAGPPVKSATAPPHENPLAPRASAEPRAAASNPTASNARKPARHLGPRAVPSGAAVQPGPDASHHERPAAPAPPTPTPQKRGRRSFEELL